MIDLNKQQRETWLGEFGDEYAKRNLDMKDVDALYQKDTGKSFVTLFKKYFDKIPRNCSILEIGCNVGLNLRILAEMGFQGINGLELNPKTCELGRKLNPTFNYINSSIESFETDKKYDVVFSNGVLMHLHPSIIPMVVKKMLSLSKEWIFGFEYYNDTPTVVKYRGRDNLLFKQNFMDVFLSTDRNLKVVMTEKVSYLNEPLTDIFYLLRKD